MEINDRFKAIRLHLSLSQPEMSAKVGLSRNAWQTYELGKSTPATPVYQSLINLGFSANWLLHGIGEMLISDASGHDFSGYSFLPLYSAVGDMGAGRQSDDLVVDWLAFSNDWLRLELRTSAMNLALMIAEGDSMLPTISPSDMLVVDHSRCHLCGDGVYVLNLAGSCLVKRVQVMVDGAVKIISDNPAYAPQVVRGDEVQSLSVAGKVVWHGKRM